MSIPRLPLILLTALAVILGGLWLVDTVAASRVERRISFAVENAANLETNPPVYVGGVPYLSALVTDEIPYVEARALDVDVEGLGMINVATRYEKIAVSPGQVLSGDISGSKAEKRSRSISLDGVALGQLIDMTDLDISNPYNISPAGGTEAEAQLIGTPPGFTEPATVIVDLRLEGSMFYMTPIELVDAPVGREDDILEAFTYSLDTLKLPLGGRAASVALGGGSIYFQAEQHNVKVQMRGLSPIAVDSDKD
ncbi:hypothetical protein CATRI_11070 [Corynebacterium atrinae]|uniref:LmeA family phospholipid-binding protein n=1 Tax=Corynebacterium atrinae TaxID=1336740 RepID=UPI0025B42770|nr:DUF2993 domain-containing protein [Corynebacterium atrinae]WJY64264.1 hypothetical protein CATRI_11070 [Corynebacterium atrinae]